MAERPEVVERLSIAGAPPAKVEATTRRQSEAGQTPKGTRGRHGAKRAHYNADHMAMVLFGLATDAPIDAPNIALQLAQTEVAHIETPKGARADFFRRMCVVPSPGDTLHKWLSNVLRLWALLDDDQRKALRTKDLRDASLELCVDPLHGVFRWEVGDDFVIFAFRGTSLREILEEGPAPFQTATRLSLAFLLTAANLVTDSLAASGDLLSSSGSALPDQTTENENAGSLPGEPARTRNRSHSSDLSRSHKTGTVNTPEASAAERERQALLRGGLRGLQPPSEHS